MCSNYEGLMKIENKVINSKNAKKYQKNRFEYYFFRKGLVLIFRNWNPYDTERNFVKIEKYDDIVSKRAPDFDLYKEVVFEEKLLTGFE